MSPRVEAITERLEGIWRRWWRCSLVSGAALAVAVALTLLLVFATLDAVFRLPQTGLAILAAIWVVVAAGLFAAVVVRTLRSRRDLAATARRLEMECPELESHLINLVQLASLPAEERDPFAEAALNRSAEAVARFPLEQAACRESRRRRFRLCLQSSRDAAESVGVFALAATAALLFALLVPGWSSALQRLLQPWEFVPSVGAVKIVKVTPGDTQVLVGAALEIAAEIANADEQPYSGTLYLRREGEGEAESAVVLTPDESYRRFTTTLPQVLVSTRYRIEVGDSQTRRYTITVQPKPAVEEVKVTYQFPPYLNRTTAEVTQKHGDLEAPQYTRAELEARASTAIGAGHVTLEGQRINGTVGDDGQSLRVTLFLDKQANYTIHLFNSAGHADPEPRVNQVRIVPDAPPAVQILEPGMEGTGASGSEVKVLVRATDDHGLSKVLLEMRREAAPASDPAQTLASWTTFPVPTEAALTCPLLLDPAKFKPGEVLLLRAVAEDRRQVDLPGVQLGPQQAASTWHKLKVISKQAQSAEKLAALDKLRNDLFKVLMQQIKARLTVTQVTQQKQPAQSQKLSADVRKDQVEIQKAATAVVEALAKAEEEEQRTMRRVVSKLAAGEMLDAVKQADALVKAETLPDQRKATGPLAKTQDRIIDVLRRLLNELRRETAEMLAEMKEKPSKELPPDVQDKLRKLRDKLDEFLKQQKKVIDATSDLAKKPVEDFTEQEKQLLEKLAATEDDWSKFMKEQHTDFSKLPEQDFANPSLLEELIEVQTQIKMAKDALTAKSAEIAVPLEQLGAEMAKEMTTNIEKWLPDTPDREKWSQEEPLTDDMKEAPMAELPKELEDIVGDLMEGEEDLFDEMEDISSSWADSIDKGAGWDAADGPISNMSARGVTGNRLPNTSEIGGRSGEGRSGKSSGEFVGDSAVGKGGRNTPTRLSNDPVMKGQVKDTSKDPMGGATGGGKESGQGGEGLQGPVPDRPQRAMERLAQKQAELRNKAESVDLQFKVMNYHRSDLRKLIDQMGAVEADLRGGRYQNVLRRREIMLDNLGRVKRYVNGEFSVRQDATSNLPTDVQKEILGSMQDASPQGWDRLNQQYFERLSRGGKPAPPAPAPKK